MLKYSNLKINTFLMKKYVFLKKSKKKSNFKYYLIIFIKKIKFKKYFYNKNYINTINI